MEEILTQEEIEELEKKLNGEDKPPIYKRIIILAMGVILLFLILSYFLAYAAFDNIPGLVESSKVKGYAISLKDGSSIFFEKQPYDELRQIFKANEGNETKLCLIGDKQGNSIIITGIHHPLIIEQDFRSVTAKPCPEGTMISLHTHPMMHCTPSYQDYMNLHHHKDAEMAAVMCKEDRIYFY
ncbi:MAG: hypothetical protein ABIB71_04735 [Candidatus Woesearchaeota archaeon]